MQLASKRLAEQNIKMVPHKFAKEILRKYDIRGQIDKTLNAKDGYYIGLSYASLLIKKGLKGKVAIAYDGRVSSPMLCEAVIKGLNDCGISVKSIELSSTPELYFATYFLKDIVGGIMITGSHNPADQNGFKLTMDGKAVFDEEILTLGEIASEGLFCKVECSISNEYISIIDSYVKKLLDLHPGLKKINAVWDPGNGAVGANLKKLTEKLPGNHIIINEKVDGNFPNHHPNPSEKKNLMQLIEKVKETNSDIGFAFDGDGDRLGVVDKDGKIIWGDNLLLIMAQDLLSRHPGSTIIGDIKTGGWVFERIAQLGGKPLMWKTGHSFIKSKMKETSALLAGEMSGHIFFSEEYYGVDDAILAAVKLLQILSKKQKPLDEIIKDFPKVISTPEISIITTEERKFNIIEDIKRILKKRNVSFVDIDGVRVSHKQGWWLIRASNTEAKLILRLEAVDSQSFEAIAFELVNLLNDVGINDLTKNYICRTKIEG